MIEHNTVFDAQAFPLSLRENSLHREQNEKAADFTSSDLRPIWLPAVDTLRNLCFAPPGRMKMILEFLSRATPVA
jgi:hypothetical protein